MSLRRAEEESSQKEIQLPAEINWEMLDKSKFFILGATLFSGVSAALYPIILLKTRQQVSNPTQLTSSLTTAIHLTRTEGPKSLYRGFGTSLTGTIPARALYMTALELTKSSVGSATVRFGIPEPTAATLANAAAGLSAAVAAQLVWTPVDVISQRLMVQNRLNVRYFNGFDACRKILRTDGIPGLYRGFGISILTYAPSNAVWWASYCVVQRVIWNGISCFHCNDGFKPSCKEVIGVQGVSAAVAGGVSALITMPLDTIKTRMQVLDNEENGGRGGRGSSVVQTIRNLVREGGWSACYRGLGPRWVSMSMSATTMITTYEFLKRLSAKTQDGVA